MTKKANPHAIQTPCKAVLSLGLLTTLLVAPFAPAHAQSALANLGTGIIETVVYAMVGIVMAVIGFKVVDWLTPGNLAEDVAHKENRALAILAGSMILGVCIIIASVLVE